MATIRKRNGKWSVQVRRKGYNTVTRSFIEHSAARSWALKVELAMENETWVDKTKKRAGQISKIVDNLIERYERFGIEIAAPKMGQLNQIKNYFQDASIHNLTKDDILDFAAARAKVVGPSTLQAQMYYLKQVVDQSEIVLQTPVVDLAIQELKTLKVIAGSERRERRLEGNEYERLLDASGKHWIGNAIEIAVTSALRQGEIHELTWEDIDLEKGTMFVMRKDKNAIGGKSKQKVPIIEGVREALLRASNATERTGRLFNVARASSISDRFARLTKKVGIDGLRFHDLRHEAISRMFERGMSVDQVRVVSGHRTLDQLSRYVNLRPEDLVGL